MTNYKLYSEKQRGLRPQGCLQNVGLTKIDKVLFIEKINVLPLTWVRSIVGQCTRVHAY